MMAKVKATSRNLVAAFIADFVKITVLASSIFPPAIMYLKRLAH
jgi:hypothetical protein